VHAEARDRQQLPGPRRRRVESAGEGLLLVARDRGLVGRARGGAFAAAAFALAVGPALAAGAASGQTLRAVALPAHVATDSFGPTHPSLGAGCGVVAFASAGSIYAHELGTQRFELVSVGATGNPVARPSGLPAVSADASRVAFDSAARLTAARGNNHDQIYLRDRGARTTILVSAAPDGALANDANLGLDTGLALDAGGGVVAFASLATNLVAGDANGSADVFVRDVATGATERASVGAAGAEARGASGYPSLSADARWVAFSSTAGNLVPGDTNGARDVFVRDREAGTTERVSVGGRGAQANGESDLPKLSADGRFVAFASDAPDLVAGDANEARDVFVFDRRERALRRVSEHRGRQADGASDYPEIGDDGARVAFASRAPNLAGGSRHQQVWVRDLRSDRLLLASAGDGGAPGNDDSGDWGIALSGDGRCVAFTSFATNLGAGRVPALFVASLPE
jgi:hypothetical protein